MIRRRLRELGQWLDDRLGVSKVLGPVLRHHVPADAKWWYVFGSATLAAFLVQILSGVTLAFSYVPSAGQAYDTLQFITNDAAFGRFMRGLHYFGASAMVLMVGVHALQTFLFGAYKYPREMTWLIGVLLLALGLLEGFTGYLLPWDQTAYWATTVGININGTGPFIGPFLAQFLQGGRYINSETLSRFYSLHMLVLPGAIIALISLHVWLVIRLGVTSPPWSKEAAGLGPRPGDPSTNGRGDTDGS